MVDRASAFRSLEEPQRRGDAAEAIVRSEFAARGVTVLVPESDNEPYDFAVEIEGTFLRIQAKTAYRHTDGTVKFETRSTRVKSDGYEREGYSGKIEYFAVYNPILDDIYLVPIDEASTASMVIRFAETENNQTAKVNWHNDFALDAQLAGL